MVSDISLLNGSFSDDFICVSVIKCVLSSFVKSVDIFSENVFSIVVSFSISVWVNISVEIVLFEEFSSVFLSVIKVSDILLVDGIFSSVDVPDDITFGISEFLVISSKLLWVIISDILSEKISDIILPLELSSVNFIEDFSIEDCVAIFVEISFVVWGIIVSDFIDFSDCSLIFSDENIMSVWDGGIILLSELNISLVLIFDDIISDLLWELKIVSGFISWVGFCWLNSAESVKDV